MFFNYLKIARRNLFKRRLTSVINLVGLTVGLTVCLLIALFVKNELSYDQFHEKAERIALLRQFEGNSMSGSNFAAFLDNELAQVEEVVRLMPEQALLATEEQSYYEDNFYFTDTSFFEVFDFPLLEGEAETALENPNSLVLTEAMATKYFGDVNPIGKNLRFNDQAELTITAVMQNTPDNSQIDIDFLCSSKNIEALLQRGFGSYWDSRAITYALFAPESDIADVSSRLPELIKATGDQNYQVWKPAFIPLRDVYLYHSLGGRVKAQAAIENVYVFSIIAIFILALACFNYVSLVTARSSSRAQEVGVRKVLGARRKQLLLQFLSESGLVIAIAVLLALGAVQLSLPFFNDFVGKELSLASLFNVQSVLLFVSGFALIALLTGSYPALVLSSFNPVTALKKTVFGNVGDAVFRKILVAVQFTVSIVMIVATVVVMNQLQYIQHKDLGYEREQVLTVTFQGDVDNATKRTLQQEIGQLAAVQRSSFISTLPGFGAYGNKLVERYVPEGRDIGYRYIRTDENFLSTFDIELKQGRNFDEQSTPDRNQYLVNQAMVDYLEWEGDAIGRELGYYTYQNSPDGGYEEVPLQGEVIGVIENYHQGNLKTAIQPLLLEYRKGNQSQLAVKISSGQTRQVVNTIEQQWSELLPNTPFEFSFLDEAFNQTYQEESRTAQVFAAFAGLAILVSCLGLLGLITFAAERRTKEIGVRKVLGASVRSIVFLLSKDFLKLVLLAMIIAAPIAWYAMQQWLERFAYRIEIQWWMFAVAGVLAVSIALLTVGFQSIRAALANPVESLRSE